jgi:hypothetical protein
MRGDYVILKSKVYSLIQEKIRKGYRSWTLSSRIQEER